MSQSKNYLTGSHRARAPRETLAWLGPLGERIGVTRLANVTGLDTIGVPVWIAIRPNSKGLATSQGKGLTHEAAKTSALMESIESWHAETIDLPVRICEYDRICARNDAVHPMSLNHFSATPPRPDLAIPWIEGFDLVTESSRWVPLEAVSTDYTVGPDGRQAEVFVKSSNGLSGGNHYLEAISHALCEVIERHAVAFDTAIFATFNPEFQLVLESVEDPYCAELITRLRNAGLLVGIWRLPTSFGIPVFACTIVGLDAGNRWRTLPAFNGYGCHLDAGVALARALTEAIQSRVTYITGSRDDISAAEYSRGGNPDDLKNYREKLQEGVPKLRFTLDETGSGVAFEEDVRRMMDVLVAAGHHQVLVVDLGKPELNIPVVKVVVPGLATPNLLIRGRTVQMPNIPADAVFR